MLHTISSCMRAFFISLVVYFVLFFFAPVLSDTYLGISFKSMRSTLEGEMASLLAERRDVLSTLSPAQLQDEVAQVMENSGSYTNGQMQRAKELLSRPEVASAFQQGVQKGGAFLHQAARLLLEELE